jgi:hypothetical protein
MATTCWTDSDDYFIDKPFIFVPSPTAPDSILKVAAHLNVWSLQSPKSTSTARGVASFIAQ